MKKTVYSVNPAWLIYILWLVAFFIGVLIAFNAPLHYGGVFLTPSFAGLFLSACLPVFLSLLFVRSMLYRFLYILVTLNGFVYGCSVMFLSLIYQGGGALFRIVYLLSQSGGMLCLLFIGASCRNMNGHRFVKISSVFCITIFLVSILHYLILTKGVSWICWI